MQGKTYARRQTLHIIQTACRMRPNCSADRRAHNRRAARAGIATLTPLYDGKDIAKLHRMSAMSPLRENHLDQWCIFSLVIARHICRIGIDRNHSRAGQRLLFSGRCRARRSDSIAPLRGNRGYDPLSASPPMATEIVNLILVSERRRDSDSRDSDGRRGNVLDIPAFALERTQAHHSTDF